MNAPAGWEVSALTAASIGSASEVHPRRSSQLRCLTRPSLCLRESSGQTANRAPAGSTSTATM